MWPLQNMTSCVYSIRMRMIVLDIECNNHFIGVYFIVITLVIK